MNFDFFGEIKSLEIRKVQPKDSMNDVSPIEQLKNSLWENNRNKEIDDAHSLDSFSSNFMKSPFE